MLILNLGFEEYIELTQYTSLVIMCVLFCIFIHFFLKIVQCDGALSRVKIFFLKMLINLRVILYIASLSLLFVLTFFLWEKISLPTLGKESVIFLSLLALIIIPFIKNFNLLGCSGELTEVINTKKAYEALKAAEEKASLNPSILPSSVDEAMSRKDQEKLRALMEQVFSDIRVSESKDGVA